MFLAQLKCCYTLLIILILCFVNCSDPQEKHDQAIELDIAGALKNKKEIKLSQIAESIQYIPLETNPRCILGKIRKVHLAGALIFVSDLKDLSIFNTQGQFINRISKNGRGPGEYTNIWDFDVLPEHRLIFVYSDRLSKVVVYDYNGSFKKEFHIHSIPSKIALVNDREWVATWPYPDFHANGNHRFSFFDFDGRHLSDHEGDKMIAQSEMGSATSASRFNRIAGTLTYFEQGLNKILEIGDQGSVNTKYTLKATGHDDLNVLTYLETRDHIFFPNCIYRNDLKRIAVDKNTHEAFDLSFHHSNVNIRLKAGFVNDIDQGYPFLPQGVSPDGRLFGFFEVLDLKDLTNQKVINPKSKIKSGYLKGDHKIQDLLDKPDSDNPILMILQPKDIIPGAENKQNI